jgi:dihydrofolate synthase/folylpolyglutamate synthase
MESAKSGKISYEDAIHALYSLQKYGIKFGLSTTSHLLKTFGNPHVGRTYVHIAGTNGKGSVAAMVEAILLEAGLRVGFYSSPHLVRFTERFRINGKEIRPEKAAAVAGEVMGAIDQKSPPTFFEVVTVMALMVFAREETDIAIMEVGMGGRLDATNVITPTVTVITNIALEHQFFLGRRLIDIAREKGGIIKPGVDLVTGATQPPVVERLEVICEEKHAPFWRLGRDIRYRTKGLMLDYYGFDKRYKALEVGLLGRHQHRNAALALAVIELLERKGFSFTEKAIRQGLQHPHWPGRMHVVAKDPLVMLDGAHNPAAVRHLADSVMRHFPHRRLIVVLGVMGDKDIGKIVQSIVPIADHVIYTRPEYHRAADPEVLMAKAAPWRKSGEVQPSVARALHKAKKMADPEDMILVTGSLFTVGEALSIVDPETYRPDGVRQLIP